LATGIAHIEQYSVDDYSTVPTIGTLFLLNFIAAIVIAVGLIAPLRRVTGRYTDAVRAVLAVGGIGVEVGSLAGLFVSETTGLFATPCPLRETQSCPARPARSCARQAAMAMAEPYVRLAGLQAAHADRMAAELSHRAVP
jgi:hypothetical protein